MNNIPKKGDYCIQLYEGAKMRCKVTEVLDGHFSVIIDGIGAVMSNIPFEKFNKDNTRLFEEAVRPLMKYLAENHHPHCTAIVTNTKAEIFEGVKTIGEVLDYIKD